MKKTYAILNLLVIIAVIFWNYLANTGFVGGNTVGELSDKYDNLFTPAGYAFSIWCIIFLALLAHGIFQVQRAFFSEKDSSFIEKIGPWLLITNIGNATWLWFWLQESTLLTIFIMLTMLVSLLTIIIKLDMQRWEAPKDIVRWVWIPISLYSGWITVATIANISAYLAKIGWQAMFSETVWTIIMVVVATIVNALVLQQRKMPVFAGVGVWAITAIAVRHWAVIPSLQWAAAICGAVLVAMIVRFLITSK